MKGGVKVVACLLERKRGLSAAGFVFFVAAVIGVGVVLQNANQLWFFEVVLQKKRMSS